LWAKWFVTCLLKTVFDVKDTSDQEPNNGLNYVTASSTVLQKGRVIRPVTAFPYFYKTPNFTTVDKTARQWSLFEPDESSPHTNNFFRVNFNIILLITPTSPNWTFQLGFFD
jgi:hypothetical protein